MGKLRLEITSLQAGSVVATLRVMVLDPESPVGVSTLAPMLQLLRASTMFQIDPQGSRVQGACAPGTLQLRSPERLGDGLPFIPREIP